MAKCFKERKCVICVANKKLEKKMINLFNKGRISALLALLSLSASPLTAWDCCEPECCPNTGRMYIGAFGGGIYSDRTNFSQMGTAFFLEEAGGPLAIVANGKSKSTSSGFGGVQIGYEWSKCLGCSDWTLNPALEIEAYWYSHKKDGHLINIANDRLDEHDFHDTFHSNTGVYLANAVFALNNSCWCGFSPYVGVGAGAARISLHGAKSLQVSPLEPGVNHFNSKRDDTNWAFAAQAKAGLRYTICDSFHLFGEYRYLYVDNSHYIFGSTIVPGHVPTSPWNVRMRNSHYNAFAFGIQYDL